MTTVPFTRGSGIPARTRRGFSSVVRRCLGDRADEVTDFALGQAPGDIGLAEHADEPVTVDDRQAPNAVLLHRADGLLGGVVGADRDHFWLIGKLAYLHRLPGPVPAPTP